MLTAPRSGGLVHWVDYPTICSRQLAKAYSNGAYRFHWIHYPAVRQARGELLPREQELYCYLAGPKPVL